MYVFIFQYIAVNIFLRKRGSIGMLEAFSAYIKNIAVFTLFAAFAELIMPENNFKKYLHFVLGLFLLTAILEPMFSLLGTDLEQKMIQKTLSVWAEEDVQKQWGEEMILDIYKKELEQKWTKELQDKFYTDAVVRVEIEKGKFLITITDVCEKGEEMKQYMKKNYDIGEILVESS